MQEQPTSNNQPTQTSENIEPIQADNQLAQAAETIAPNPMDNQPTQPPQTITIALPQDEHSTKTVISALSNGAIVAGAGLGLFNHYGAQIAGTACKTIGFGLNQVCDGLKNQAERNKAASIKKEFNRKREAKKHGHTVNLEPLTWKSRYGINQTDGDTAANIIITLINTLFQLLACGFLISRIINLTANTTDSKEGVAWGMLGGTLFFDTLAFVFDKIEQHIKQTNLSCYQAQLKEGIAKLDALPDDQSPAPTNSRPQLQ